MSAIHLLELDMWSCFVQETCLVHLKSKVCKKYIISSRRVQIEVNHHDGSAARNVLVHFGLLKEPILVSSGSTRVAVDMPAGGGPQTITVSVTAGQVDL